MRILITGAEGFTGSHLTEYCLAQGDEVWGTCRPGARTTNLKPFLDQITLRIGDLSQPDLVRGILKETHFDAIYHLAALNVIHDVLTEPARAYEVNLLGGIHLLEAVRTQSPKTRVVMASSAEVYGNVKPENLPIVETHPFAPINIFAAGKAALELATLPYIHIYGLQVVIARPFNHTGPRQRPDFVCSSLAAQIAQIENGAKPVIHVGNLAPCRDFSDVRDIVRGYRLLSEKGVPGEAYNLAAGASVSVEHILTTLTQMAQVKVEILQDSARMRDIHVLDVRGSHEKVTAATGWQPEIPLQKTLRDLLNYHRDMIAGRKPR